MILRTCVAAFAVCLTAMAGGVSVSLDVIRCQADGNTLRVLEGLAVSNDSGTRQSFEVQLPAGARLNSAVVRLADGRQFSGLPKAGGKEDRYVFPLGPGNTRFGLDYSLPHASGAEFENRVVYPTGQVVVVLPEAAVFHARKPGLFEPVPGRPANFQQTGALQAGQVLAFGISGKGTFADLKSVAPPPVARSAPERRRSGWVFPAGIALILAAAGAGLRSHKRKRIHHETANLACG